MTDDMAAQDKLNVIYAWHSNMVGELLKEYISYEELLEIDAVFDVVKVFMEEK